MTNELNVMNEPGLTPMPAETPMPGGLQLVATTDPGVVTGRQVHWSLKGDVEDVVIEQALALLGVNLDIPIPHPAGPEGAIAHAMRDLGGQKGLLARPTNGGGWVLVKEMNRAKRGRPRKVKVGDAPQAQVPWTGDPVLYCRYVEGQGEVIEGDTDLGAALPGLILHYRTHVTTHELAFWLPRAVRALDGIGLRPTGGIYFVPAGGVDMWSRIVAALASATAHKFYGIPVMRTEDAAAAFLDAMQVEAEAFAVDTFTEAPNLGEKARATRRAAVKAMTDKLGRYETLFGEGRLAAVREKMSHLDMALSATDLTGLPQVG